MCDCAHEGVLLCGHSWEVYSDLGVEEAEHWARGGLRQAGLLRQLVLKAWGDDERQASLRPFGFLLWDHA